MGSSLFTVGLDFIGMVVGGMLKEFGLNCWDVVWFDWVNCGITECVTNCVIFGVMLYDVWFSMAGVTGDSGCGKGDIVLAYR